MAGSGDIKKSWQEYDITVLRAVPANNWSGDESVPELTPPVAVWKFESGALYDDSMGKQGDWYRYNETWPEAVADSDCMEGASSLLSNYYNDLGSELLQINYANVSADFPSKVTTNVGSVCFWMKLHTVPLLDVFDEYCYFGAPGFSAVVMQDGTNALSAGIDIYKAAGGTDAIYTGEIIQLDRWYHVGIAWDADNCRVRVWGETEQAIMEDKYAARTGSMLVRETPLYLKVTNPTHHEGEVESKLLTTNRIDELVAFNRVISVAEIDAIRQQQWPPT